MGCISTKNDFLKTFKAVKTTWSDMNPLSHYKNTILSGISRPTHPTHTFKVRK